MIYRKATPEDLDEVVDLCLSLARYEASLMGREVDPESVRRRISHDLLHGKDLVYFVAEFEGRIVSVLKVSLEEGRGKVSEAYTLPEHRNKGIMTRLFERALSWLSEKGVWEVYLTVVIGNTPAKLFWASKGFREYQVSNNLIYMKRDLEAS